MSLSFLALTDNVATQLLFYKNKWIHKKSHILRFRNQAQSRAIFDNVSQITIQPDK